MADWSQLAYDLLVLIANQMLNVEDFLAFSSVCHNWRSVYQNKDWTPRQQNPWLMLSEHYNHEHNVVKRRFLTIRGFKYHDLPLPEAHGCKCWGTSHGWIVTLDQSLTVCLLNPLTRVGIKLPPISMLSRSVPLDTDADWFVAIQNAFVFKVGDKFITMIIYEYNSSLAFFRHGDGNWTRVGFPFPVRLLHVVCFKDQILALTVRGTLMLIDTDGPDGPNAVFVASPPQHEKTWSNRYLVESSDNLLLVYKKGKHFKVYGLDIPRREWIALNDLGDAFLLVDDYNCTSAPSCEYSSRNTIYLVSDNSSDISDSTLLLTRYSMKYGAAQDFRLVDGSLSYTCPVWMIPRLW